MGTALAIVVAAALLAAALLGATAAGAARAPRRGSGPSPKAGPGGERTGPRPGSCPLCSRALGPGERVKSDIVPGRGDRLMRIFGCPACWPPREGSPRICPVCGATIGDEGWAVARLFERPGRKHVHVLGCTGCRGAGRRSER